MRFFTSLLALGSLAAFATIVVANDDVCPPPDVGTNRTAHGVRSYTTDSVSRLGS